MIIKNDYLQSKLDEYPQDNYPIHSRVHPLRTFSTERTRLFVKREDELGFGISGCKFRKYRTLLPYIRAKGCKEVVLIGGAYSNHIFSLAQLLIENGIRPILLLKGPKPLKNVGNFLFLQMLLPPNSFHWIPKEEWGDVHKKALIALFDCKNSLV